MSQLLQAGVAPNSPLFAELMASSDTEVVSLLVFSPELLA
jgi:hypothetical protein